MFLVEHGRPVSYASLLVFARPATSKPPFALASDTGGFVVPTLPAMTLDQRTIESIDDIAYYLKCIVRELNQFNAREEAKIKSEDDVQRYIRERDDD